MCVLRVAAVAVIVASLAACGSGDRATAPLGHPTTTPPTLSSVRSYLAHYHYLILRRLPKSAAIPVEARRAEAVVLGRTRNAGARKGVSATLVSATNMAYCKRLPDGSCRKIIENRPVWIVLVPNQQVPIIYPRGKTGPRTYWATMATLVDARSGKYLMAAAVPTD